MSEPKPHPAALEAQQKAEKNQIRRAHLKSLVDHATKFGVRFIEIAPYNYEAKKPSKQGRMTIAYLVHHRNVVMVSTAICHPDDQFDKLQGRAFAASNILNHKAILVRLPIDKNRTIKSILADMFTLHTY